MADTKPFDLLNVGGGLNDGVPASHIKDEEFAQLQNFYPFGTKLIRRHGMRRITTSAFAEALSSFFAYKTSAGSWTLLCGAKTGFAKLSGQQIVSIPFTAGDILNSINDPWVFKQYRDVGYAVRRGTAGLWRVTPDFAQAAGIAAHAVAPTIAQGGAGALDAGNYYAVFTGYNSDTGVESNPSPASGVLALAASKVISWSNIGVFTTPQVNARRLYRTLKDQLGEYYFVAQINDNVTTTYSDNVVTADLGSQVSFDNGMPPNSLESAEVWQERLFTTDGVDLFFSEIALMECFAEDSVISVFPDDGHRILPLHAFGDRLIIGKTNAIHYLLGSDRASFTVRTLSDRHGAGSRYGMSSAEGLLFWYGNDNNVYRSDGQSVVSITTVKVREIMDSIPDDRKGQVVAAVYPRLSWLILSIPTSDSDQNDKVLVYNYKTDAWTTFTHPSEAPYFLADFFDAESEHVIYASLSDGHLYQYNDPEALGQDYGNAITAKFRTKAFAFGGLGLKRAFHRVGLLCNQVAESLVLRAYSEKGTSSIKSRTVSLDYPAAWKLFNFSTLGAPATLLQLEGEYTGDDVLEIDGLTFHTLLLQNRGRAR